MSKSAKKRSSASASPVVATAKPSQAAPDKPKSNSAEAGSKQARVIAMLRAPSGATIAAMVAATGWQQHSVRGFLAGVVRKRLKLKLGSNKVDGHRIYRIMGGAIGKSSPGRTGKKAP
jgi:hypothetical protein